MSTARFSTIGEPTSPPGGKVIIYVDEDDKHLKQIDEDGTVHDLTDTTPLSDEEFANKVGDQTDLTGVVPIDDIVSLNADTTKIDIISFDYFIQGAHYNYTGGTAIIPTIAAGDSSTWVGVDSTSILFSDDKFTDEETKTILPLARLQALQGQSGPGSDLQEPIQLTFAIGQEGYNERQWIEQSIGVLYTEGGTYSENTSVPLQIDQESGIFYNAQRRRISFATTANIEVSRVYHVGGIPTVQNRSTLIIPKYYDDGTDTVALPTNKYVSHTLLRSPKEENLFFLIYGSTVYDSQSQAEEAPVDYSIFQGQAISGLYKAARFIIKGDSTNIEAIQDERPRFILEDESTGKGTRPPSYACEYLSASAETTITTAGVFVKVAGTITGVTTSADFTIVGNNRFLYTGKEKRRFKVDVVCSVTSVGNNQTVRARFAINGVTTAPSEQQQVGVGTRVGNIPLSCMPELEENDYIEFWIANVNETSNLTVDYMNMNLISVD